MNNNTLLNQTDYTKNKCGNNKIARCSEPRIDGSCMKKYNQLSQKIDMVNLNGVQPKLADKSSTIIWCFVGDKEVLG